MIRNLFIFLSLLINGYLLFLLLLISGCGSPPKADKDYWLKPTKVKQINSLTKIYKIEFEGQYYIVIEGYDCVSMLPYPKTEKLEE